MRHQRTATFAGDGGPPEASPGGGERGPLARRRRRRRRSRILTWLAPAAALLVLGAIGVAPATAAAPWWNLDTSLRPANLRPGGEGTLIVAAENVGDGPTSGPVALHMSIPTGLEIVEEGGVPQISFLALNLFKGGLDLGTTGFFANRELCSVSGSEVTCDSESANPEFPFALPPMAPYENLEMRVTVKDLSAPPGAEATGRVSGGGLPPSSSGLPIEVAESDPSFGTENLSIRPEEEGGALDTQAGSHPFQLTTTFALKQSASPTDPPALPRNLDFQLTPGQIGNPTALPKCSELAFSQLISGTFSNRCPADTAIGVASVTFDEPSQQHLRTYPVPLFNLTPAPGEPARFGFEVAKSPVILDTSLRSGPGGDYGVTVSTHNVTQLTNFISSSVTFWGTPAAAAHEKSRGWSCLIGGGWNEEATEATPPCAPSSQPDAAPFLTLPTNCTTPFSLISEGLSWPTLAAPGGSAFAPFGYSLSEGGDPLTMTGCDQLPFAPKITAAPTSLTPSSPSGLNFELNFADPGLQSAEVLAESQVKKTVVTLPRGVTTNPAVAGGLIACSLAQYHEESLETEAGCPASSKIGEVEIESPLVESKIDGAIYVARQHENPADDLLSIYMVAKNPGLGVLVRSSGAVSPDPQTGQLTTTFGIDGEPLPQLPFSHFQLHFREGPRAPLIAPGLCGTYQTQADLYPWSDPTAPVRREASFTVGAPCPGSAAQQPNSPTLSAGTTSPIAGAYAPFVFKVSREDGSQILSQISATLPEGLLGKLAGIPYCSAGQIAQAEGRSGEGQGALELDSPSCPAASQVGTVDVATGAGPQPYHVQGKAYLAGPYKGAPLSLAIITPAIAGPFDLGTVVVRTALQVDEATAQIHAVSDPLPTILHGLPLVVRSVSLNMDRANFTLNPTSCDPMQVTGSATSTLGAVAPLSERFQVGACGALGFKPNLKLAYSGQTKRAGNPALKSVIAYPKGDYANIARASVTLPKGVLISNAHINNPCTRVQFNSTAQPGEACPPKSVLGSAKVWTPLLEAPESGKVYFRSNGGERELPDLVIALRGQIPVQLVGFIDSVGRKGAEVRRVRTRFQSVPDAPVSRFELKLYGGKRGLLESSQNLCQGSPPATIQLTAQNGKTYDTEPTVSTACGKRSKGKGSRARTPKKA
jgi:hypothetical protein